MLYIQVSAKLDLFVFDIVIRNALAQENYYRRVARKKFSIFKKIEFFVLLKFTNILIKLANNKIHYCERIKSKL